jgi:hypothetical protein
MTMQKGFCKSGNRGVKNGSSVVSQLLPWYAFASPWRLIAYVYPLLPYYIATSEYLNTVSRQIAKTKSSCIYLNCMFDLPHFLSELYGLLPVCGTSAANTKWV